MKNFEDLFATLLIMGWTRPGESLSLLHSPKNFPVDMTVMANTLDTFYMNINKADDQIYMDINWNMDLFPAAQEYTADKILERINHVQRGGSLD
jgi:hypothetical protein